MLCKANRFRYEHLRKTANFQAYASLSQAGAWASLLRGEMSWPQADAEWRAKGGKANLSQVIGTPPDLSPAQIDPTS